MCQPYGRLPYHTACSVTDQRVELLGDARGIIVYDKSTLKDVDIGKDLVPVGALFQRSQTM